MATFKYYNVQVLPLNKGKMIGSEGYQKIFKDLKILVDENIEMDSINGIAHKLQNDFFIAPIKIHIRDDIAYGEIMKFDTVSSVFGTLDNKEKYVSSGGDSSKKYIYRFVFDFNKHILAIEKSQNLPSAKVLISILTEMLGGHSQVNYPDYALKIMEMTDSESLKAVINDAASYKKVEVDITFSNSEDWSEGLTDVMLEKLESELKSNSIDSVHHIEKSEKGTMTEPSNIAKMYLSLACKFGNASIAYKNLDGRINNYKMTDNPIVLQVKDNVKGKIKSTLDFALDIKKTIKDADSISKKATSIIDNLRKG
nr:DUF4747 family protein [Moritella viscosa]SHO17742.1 Putative uncharacterized protein [Moritella viscosa]